MPTTDPFALTETDARRELAVRYAKGNAASVVTRNGRVIGVWDLGKKDKPLRIRVAPLTAWSTSLWDAVALQVEKIRLFLDQPNVTIERCSDAVDLTTAKKNQHLYPLSD